MFPGPGTAHSVTGCTYTIGANISDADVYTIAKCMSNTWADATPSAGGTLTINSASLASYDYMKVTGNQTVSSFSSATWFTSTADSRSAWVIINGDLTINSGQTFIPSVRKLFTVVYVTGSCTISGSISMTARGANHSSTGSNITAAAIKIASGTYSGVTDPTIPAAGAIGGASTTGVTANGGVTGTAGQTGGGSGGTGYSASGYSGGAGAQGTSFSGGPGGGSAGADPSGGNGIAGGPNGGRGGNTTSTIGADGAGAGNPQGTAGPGTPAGPAAVAGTGGTLILICGATYSGAGTVVSAGSDGGGSGAFGGGNWGVGGPSGGGSVNVLVHTNSGPTPTAPGGNPQNGTQGSRSGTVAGAGTARVMTGI